MGWGLGASEGGGGSLSKGRECAQRLDPDERGRYRHAVRDDAFPLEVLEILPEGRGGQQQGIFHDKGGKRRENQQSREQGGAKQTGDVHETLWGLSRER